MRNIKCPFCNEELEPIIGACEDTEYYCQNCDYMTGDENLWNQLIKYKQALGIAVKTLERLDKELYFNNAKQTDYVADSVVQIPGIVIDQIKQITETKGE